MAVCDIPDYEFENLARSFLPAMQKYFSSEEGMAAYEKWLSAVSFENVRCRKTYYIAELLRYYPYLKILRKQILA